MLLLLIFTKLLRHFSRWQAIDYLALYILLTLGTAPVCFDGIHALTGLLAFPFSPFAWRPDWTKELFQNLPRWAVMSDGNAANAFVLGGHDFWSKGLWKAWLTPIAGWTWLLVTVSIIYLGLSCFLYHQGMGLSPTFAFAFFCLFFLAAVTVARIRAELGAAIYGMLGMGPLNMLWRTVGIQAFTPTDLTVGMGLLTWGITYGQRSNLMALQVESLKVAESVGGAAPSLSLGMVGASGLGTLLGLVFAASVFTKQGALAGRISLGYHDVFVWGYSSLNSWRFDPPKFNATSTTAVGVGVLVTMLL